MVMNKKVPIMQMHCDRSLFAINSHVKAACCLTVADAGLQKD